LQMLKPILNVNKILDGRQPMPNKAIKNLVNSKSNKY
jgi:hypothetical protein